MYVQKSKLQHAADAAVLAGGYTYVADWDDPDKRTQVLNTMKKYLNSDIDNGQIEKVVYRFKDNDESKGVMISLYAKKIPGPYLPACSVMTCFLCMLWPPANSAATV